MNVFNFTNKLLCLTSLIIIKLLYFIFLIKELMTIGNDLAAFELGWGTWVEQHCPSVNRLGERAA